MNETHLLKPGEVDILLRYPRGRSLRLARKGLLPYVRLPDGSVRFDEREIQALLTSARVRDTTPETKNAAGPV